MTRFLPAALMAAFIAISLGLFSSGASAQIILFEKNKVLENTKSGDYDSLRQELLKGANADSVDRNGKTALFEAAINQDVAIMELLLEHGAHVDWTDHLDNTALYYSADRGNYESVRFLLDSGANPNSVNSQGVTPLMVAARLGDVDIFTMLVDANANLDAQDYSGKNIMDYARESRNGGIVSVAQRAGVPD